jgi:macrolide-specific efflux system membrane fusion protein
MNRKTIVVAAVIVIAVTIAGWFGWRALRPAAVSYTEQTVTRGAIRVTILSTGTVQPENRLEIKAPVAGRAEQVLVQEGARVRKGQVLAWVSSTERAALLDAARARGAEELAHWEQLYRATPVMAPIDGTIILRQIEAGQTFTTQDALLVLSDRLTVKAQVDETDIARVRLKQKADIILDAYSEVTIPARVDRIAFEATTVSNVTTYIVDVLPVKTPDFMRAGMTANVGFVVAEKADVLLLPTRAVIHRNGNTLVRVPSTRKGAPPREVEIRTGITDGKTIEVVAGLSEGDTVLSAQATAGSKRSNGFNPFSPFRPARR